MTLGKTQVEHLPLFKGSLEALEGNRLILAKIFRSRCLSLNLLRHYRHL